VAAQNKVLAATQMATNVWRSGGRNLGRPAAANPARWRHNTAVMQPQSGGNRSVRRQGRDYAAAACDFARHLPHGGCVAAPQVLVAAL